MDAFLSDIHGNLCALEAVLDEMTRLGVRRIFCLGDVVGYGPSPRECIQRAMGFDLCLRGNHEAALLFAPEDFNPHARAALEWTRDRLNASEYPREMNHALWRWLDSLPEQYRTEEALLVHGSPRDPVREYMLPHDVRDTEKMAQVFARMDRPLCLVGHSHVPGIFTEDLRFISPNAVGGTWKPEGGKVLVNVGSVGQPRDGDPRACFVTRDGGTLRFHRVPYDVRDTAERILGTGTLPGILAYRLEEGR